MPWQLALAPYENWDHLGKNFHHHVMSRWRQVIKQEPICLTSQKCFLMSSQILPRILQITRHESFPWKKHNQFLVFTTSNYTLWYPSRLLIIMLSGIIFQLNMIMYIIKLYNDCFNWIERMYIIVFTTSVCCQAHHSFPLFVNISSNEGGDRTMVAE